MFAFPLAFDFGDGGAVIAMLGLLICCCAAGWGMMAARRVGYTWPGLPQRGSGRRPDWRVVDRVRRGGRRGRRARRVARGPAALTALVAPGVARRAQSGCRTARPAVVPNPYDRGMSTRIAFLKGHGTENDFVIIPDPENVIDLPPAAVAALCDRRAGIGGDGLLHVVRSAAHPEARAMAAEAEWFMDYRNGDGSIAEMCGNGVRVFARYLQRAGHVAEGDIAVATRGGVKTVHIAKERRRHRRHGQGTPPRRGRHRERRRAQLARAQREHGQSRTPSPSWRTSTTPEICTPRRRSAPPPRTRTA